MLLSIFRYVFFIRNNYKILLYKMLQIGMYATRFFSDYTLIHTFT